MARSNKTAPGETAAEKTVATVAMHREVPPHEGGPTTADVHPDEVGEWLAQGWELEADDPV